MWNIYEDDRKYSVSMKTFFIISKKKKRLYVLNCRILKFFFLWSMWTNEKRAEKKATTKAIYEIKSEKFRYNKTFHSKTFEVTLPVNERIYIYRSFDTWMLNCNGYKNDVKCENRRKKKTVEHKFESKKKTIRELNGNV